ncbi:MAG: DMT family transporter [Hyphomicrobiaceae bacterium]|nr:DMT family transporter [Hyphomicrobiaceae bacterium]MCC0024197.1 DMT family transporter [Hyphomicrobiaceae bacterium]
MSSPQHAGSTQKGWAHLLLDHPYVLLVLAPVFWGGNITAGKLAVGQIAPEMLVLGRWVGASLILLPFAWNAIRRDWPKIMPGLPALFFYGALGFAGFNMAMYTAAAYTAAVNASIEQAAIPVLVLLGNFLIFSVRPRLLQIVGLILTIIGVIWVATHGEPARLLHLDVNFGDALVLLACLFYAAYSLTLRYRPDISWMSFIFITALSALVASLIFTMFSPGGIAATIPKAAEITPLGWACLAYVMVFPSILAQLCYARGLHLVGPNRASIFINLLPLTGTILSVLIIGERLEPFHMVAAILVIAGIVLAEYSVRRNK